MELVVDMAARFSTMTVGIKKGLTREAKVNMGYRLNLPAKTETKRVRRSKVRFDVASAILLFLSTLVTLVIAEVFLRLFPSVLPEEVRLRIHWREVEEQVSTIAHPHLGFVFPPNQLGERTSTDFTFSFRTDERGFRNPSPWPPEAEIVVAGDSMAFGYGVDDDAVWSRRVAERLPMSRLINLGLIGAAPQQYVRVFELFGVPLKPKLFVFGLFPGNDYYDADKFDQWLAAGSPGNYDVWRFFDGDTPGLAQSILKETYLYMLLRVLRNNIGRRQSGSTIELPDGGTIQLAPAIYSREAARAEASGSAFQRVISIIEKAQRAARVNGAQFVVLLFPTKEEVYLPLYGEPAPALIAPLATKLNELRIPFFDLTAPLQSAAQSGAALYFEVDGHPNDLGYQVIADAVYAHLVKNAKLYGLRDWDSKSE